MAGAKVPKGEIDGAFQLIEIGEIKSALETFKSLSVKYPNDPSAFLGLGHALLKSSRYEEAIVAYEEALLNAPGTALIYHDIAICNVALKEFAKADEMEDHAVQNDHNNIDYMLASASLKLRLGKYDRAKEVAEGIVNFLPNDSRGYYFLAKANWIIGMQARDNEIIKLSILNAEKSYRLDPNTHGLRHLLFGIYAQSGRLDKALLASMGTLRLSDRG